MEAIPKYNPLPRAIALILVAACGAWFLHRSDLHALSTIDSMSRADYIEHQRHLHRHSYLFAFAGAVVVGGFFLGVVDTVTFLVRAVMPKRRGV